MIAFGAIRKVLRWAIVTQRASGLAGTKQFEHRWAVVLVAPSGAPPPHAARLVVAE